MQEHRHAKLIYVSNTIHPLTPPRQTTRCSIYKYGRQKHLFKRLDAAFLNVPQTRYATYTFVAHWPFGRFLVLRTSHQIKKSKLRKHYTCAFVASSSLRLEPRQMGFQTTPGPPRWKSEKHRFKNIVVSVSSPPKEAPAGFLVRNVAVV